MFIIQIYGSCNTEPLEKEIRKVFNGEEYAIVPCDTCFIRRKESRKLPFMRIIDENRKHGLQAKEKLIKLGDIFLSIEPFFRSPD